MRKIVMFVLLLMAGYYCNAQNGSYNGSLNERVRITKWGQKVFGFPDNYWNNKWSEEIIEKIGEEEFEKAKSSLKGYDLPVEMSMISGIKMVDTAALYKRMDRLKMYRIATYTQGGEGGKIFEMAILRVPYEDNKEWEGNAKWGVLYFFIENKYVEVVD